MADQSVQTIDLTAERGDHRDWSANVNEQLLTMVALDQNAKLKELDKTAASHEGQIKGLQSAISAVQSAISTVQSSLNGWLSVVGIVASILLGLALYNLNRTNSVGEDVKSQSQRIGSLEVKVGLVDNRAARIEDQLEALPEQVARELRTQEAEATRVPQE